VRYLNKYFLYLIVVSKSKIIENIGNNPSKFAEFIGILLGDGSLSRYVKSNHYRLQITLDSREEQYKNYVCGLICSLFDINPIIKYRKKENTVDILVFNRNIIRLLNEKFDLKYSPKWNRAVIPYYCRDSSLELDVLRGYFDTDGSVVLTNNNGIIYPRLEMKICPSPMQKQFIEILKRNSFRFGVYDIGKGKVRIQLNGKEQLTKWIKLINFSNKRHLDKVNKFQNYFPVPFNPSKCILCSISPFRSANPLWIALAKSKSCALSTSSGLPAALACKWIEYFFLLPSFSCVFI
jgi:hypothetical protein